MNKRHIILDFEFNPINKKYGEERLIAHNEIIQIGAVMLDENYKMISSFSVNVKPKYNDHIVKKVAKLTGITDADVENAPHFEEALQMLVYWIGADDNVHVYSWSLSDLDQLEDECYLKNIHFPGCFENWVDFQREFGELIHYNQQMSLKNAVAAVGTRFVPTHSALSDALATAELLALAADKENFRKRSSGIRSLFEPVKRSTIGDKYGAQLAAMFA